MGVNFNHVTKYTTQGAEVLSHKHKRLLCQTLKCFTRIKSGDNLQENIIFTDEEIKVMTCPRSYSFRAGNRLKLSLLPWVKNFKLSLSKLDLGFINYSSHRRDNIKHVIWSIRIIEQTLKGTQMCCLSQPQLSHACQNLKPNTWNVLTHELIHESSWLGMETITTDTTKKKQTNKKTSAEVKLHQSNL